MKKELQDFNCKMKDKNQALIIIDKIFKII